MSLFIDTVSNPTKIILFSDNRDIINYIEWDIKWNESSLLIPKIDEIIRNNNLEYKNLDNLVVINWPGSFTELELQY